MQKLTELILSARNNLVRKVNQKRALDCINMNPHQIHCREIACCQQLTIIKAFRGKKNPRLPQWNDRLRMYLSAAVIESEDSGEVSSKS